MPDNPPDTSIQQAALPISVSSPSGSKIVSVYVGRKVKVFAVHEPELDNISLLNTASLILFSVASFFLSVAARNGLNKEIVIDSTIWVSLVLYILGGIALFFKKSILKRIKDESVTVP